jgi:hypothetical protein
MKKGERKGLLVVWADIDEDYRHTFRMWHNCEHVSERVSLPGFCTGYRYEGIGKAPNYIMFYEGADSKVFGSEAYLYSLNNPTPGTKDAIAHFKNPGRTIYGLLATAGKKPPVVAPYIFVERFSPEKGSDREVMQWYSKELLPRRAMIPGVCRGRLYEVDPAISDLMTTERKIHAAAIGEQRFLCLYEIASLDLCASQAWRECQTGTDKTQNRVKKMDHLLQEVYWLDFTMDAPEPD